MKIDLHVHTNASDGVFPVEEVIQKAYSNGVRVLAITDHDTVAAIPRAIEYAKKYADLTLIPGIEMSSHCPGNEVHMLGYFIDYKNQIFLDKLQMMRDSRIGRAAAMVEKLNALGMDITIERVKEIAGDANIGRPHIAKAILEKGYAANWDEVFEKYLGFNGAAYVERIKLTPVEAVKLMQNAGAITVMAHPFLVDDYKKIVPELIEAGLDGMETYYKDFSADERKEIKKFCDNHNLLATGGTDFHGLNPETEVMLGDSGVPQEVAINLLELAKKKGVLKNAD